MSRYATGPFHSLRYCKAYLILTGVLTKPDRLQPGEPLDLFKEMLSNRKFRLGHGYLSTKQPSSADIKAGMNHAEARRAESQMFGNQAPWTTELSAFKDQFGTARLQVKLSQLLAGLVTASLPSIKALVEQKIQAIVAELSQFPKAPGDGCLSMVFSLLGEFHTRLDKSMEGEYRYNAFILQWRSRIKDWRQTLSDMKPSLFVNVKEPEADWKTSSTGCQEAISIDSDDDTPCPTVGTKRPPSASPITPSIHPNKRFRGTRVGTPGGVRKAHREYFSSICKKLLQSYRHTSSCQGVELGTRLPDAE